VNGDRRAKAQALAALLAVIIAAASAAEQEEADRDQRPGPLRRGPAPRPGPHG
jgi:hypothetical protein